MIKNEMYIECQISLNEKKTKIKILNIFDTQFSDLRRKYEIEEEQGYYIKRLSRASY